MTREVGFGDPDKPDLYIDPSWDGILDPHERILWQGRPDSSTSFTAKNTGVALFGCAFAGFALFWMVMASQAGGYFWMFGLLHFLVGVGIILSAIFGSAYLRKRTWYTLTNKRAMIGTQLPIKGKGLKSYPITKDTELDFRDEQPASIFFAQKIKRGKNGSHTVNVGFERIDDGRKVYGIFRKIQGGRV